MLKRASSVPTRPIGPEQHETNPSAADHNDKTTNQQQNSSIDTQLDVPMVMTSSTTEESMTGGLIATSTTANNNSQSSTEPLLLTVPAHAIIGTIGITKTDSNGQPRQIQNLPNIIPIRGHLHQQGWL